MKPFATITSHSASLPDANVDTDIIFPARFLLITEKRGLGRYAFHDKRQLALFPPEVAAKAGARILIVGENFGCGSSREQAPWALLDMGFEVLIGPSFGEIFAANCAKNGMLAITLPHDQSARLHEAANALEEITVDLTRKEIRLPHNEIIAFAIDPAEREGLLNGWDEMTRIRAVHASHIARFEEAQRQSAPWLWSFDTKAVNV